VPEGDTIFRAARTLHRALAGQIVTAFETQLPKLARVDQDHPLAGRTVESVDASGKWMHMHFSGDLILLTHMLMSGSWHIYRPGEPWRKSRYHMRIVFATQSIVAVAFNVQVAEFHTAASLARRAGYNELGPDILAENFDETAAVANLANRPDLEVGVALLSQSLLAGIGNVYKSEACFLAGIHPFRKVGGLSPAELRELVSVARRLMLANITDAAGSRIVTYTGFRRTTGRSDPEQRLWVYHRGGEPCRRCGAAIESRKQGEDARITFWCPHCQPLAGPA
jgi:endonuclease-8